MKRTFNKNIKLIKELIKHTVSRTKTEAIEDLISLSGKIDIDPGWRRRRA